MKIFVLICFVIGLFAGCDQPPPKHTNYDYVARKVVELDGTIHWHFEGKFPPPLNLSDSENFIDSVNAALRSIDLKEIYHSVPEKAEITGNEVNRTQYEWTDYRQGVLMVHRTTTTDANYDNYDAIYLITLYKRE